MVWCVQVIWNDPNLIKQEVWYGSLTIAVSVLYMFFVFYVSFFPPRRPGFLAGVKRFPALLIGWLVLFIMQLSYIASRGVIVYGVAYNETSMSYEYLTAENPMMAPVIGITVVVAIIVIGVVLIAYSSEQFGRATRRVYVEY
jgi:uncharacterized membrane protein